MASRRSETKLGHATAVAAVATLIFRSGSLALAVQMLLLFATPLPLRCTHTKLLTRSRLAVSLQSTPERWWVFFCSGISHKKGTAAPRFINGDHKIQFLNDLGIVLSLYGCFFIQIDQADCRSFDKYSGAYDACTIGFTEHSFVSTLF